MSTLSLSTTESVLALVFVCFSAIQLFDSWELVSTLKREYPDLWAELGSPDLNSPNGQWILSRFVLGLRTAPPYPDPDLRRACIRIRSSSAIALAAFIALSFLLAFGAR